MSTRGLDEIRWRVSSMSWSNESPKCNLSEMKRGLVPWNAAEKSIQDAKRTRWHRREWLTFQVYAIPPMLEFNCSEQSINEKQKMKWKENYINCNRMVTGVAFASVVTVETELSCNPSELDFCHFKIYRAFWNCWP